MWNAGDLDIIAGNGGLAWRCRENQKVKTGQLIDSLGPDASMERDVALYHLADAYLGVDPYPNLAMKLQFASRYLFAGRDD